MNISIMVAQELYDLGFSYRHYKEHISKGMVYYYDNNEWVIGGNANEPITDFQEKIVKNGIWLPSENHLIEWLLDNDFTFSIVNNDGFFEVNCLDSITGTKYSAKLPTLEFAIAAIIKKILKKHEREFDLKDKIFGVIE